MAGANEGAGFIDVPEIKAKNKMSNPTIPINHFTLLLKIHDLVNPFHIGIKSNIQNHYDTNIDSFFFCYLTNGFLLRLVFQFSLLKFF